MKNANMLIKIGGTVASVLYALGAVLPFVSIQIIGMTLSLIDGTNCIPVFSVALLALVSALSLKKVILLISGICSLGLFIFFATKIHMSIDYDNAYASYASIFITKGAGFYLLLFGSILILACAVAAFIISRKSSQCEATRGEKQSQTKQCPYCAETIKREAILCRYCQSKLEPITVEESAMQVSAENEPEQKDKKSTKLNIFVVVISILLALTMVVSLLYPYVSSWIGNSSGNNSSTNINVNHIALISDYDNSLPSEVQNNAVDMLQETADIIGCDVAVIFSDDIMGMTEEAYIDDYYRRNIIHTNAIILLFNNDSNSAHNYDWIRVYGKAYDIYINKIDDIFNNIYEGYNMGQNNYFKYYKAIEYFCEYLKENCDN